MKNPLVFLLVFALCQASYGQELIPGTSARLFEVEFESENIQFIKTDSSFVRKPIIIFCQGSLPRPLVIELDQGYKHFANYNFDYEALSRKYHLITLNMPFTPAVSRQDDLNPSLCYVPNVSQPNTFDSAYQQHNYLDYYVSRLISVLDHLSGLAWVDPGEVILIGHSQGSKVALKTAIQYSGITHVALLSLNPQGRFDQSIRNYRLAEQNGELSSEEAQKKIDQLYDRWRDIYKSPLDDQNLQGDTHRAITSFSEYLVDDLLALEIPVFVAYGTKDVGAQTCDLLPLEFVRAGKNNLQFRPYPGLGHNFEEIAPDGKANFEKMHWQDVIGEIMDWIDETAK